MRPGDRIPLDGFILSDESRIDTVPITGDATLEANAVAAETAIPEVYARQLPDEKLESLRQLRQKHGPVMFVGGGVR